MYEITYTTTGKTVEMDYDEAVNTFGDEEFNEILQGRDPVIVAVLMDDDREPDVDWLQENEDFEQADEYFGGEML